jgi:hypothetical protein
LYGEYARVHKEALKQGRQRSAKATASRAAFRTADRLAGSTAHKNLLYKEYYQHLWSHAYSFGGEATTSPSALASVLANAAAGRVTLSSTSHPGYRFPPALLGTVPPAMASTSLAQHSSSLAQYSSRLTQHAPAMASADAALTQETRQHCLATVRLNFLTRARVRAENEAAEAASSSTSATSLKPGTPSSVNATPREARLDLENLMADNQRRLVCDRMRERNLLNNAPAPSSFCPPPIPPPARSAAVQITISTGAAEHRASLRRLTDANVAAAGQGAEALSVALCNVSEQLLLPSSSSSSTRLTTLTARPATTLSSANAASEALTRPLQRRRVGAREAAANERDRASVVASRIRVEEFAADGLVVATAARWAREATAGAEVTKLFFLEIC